MPVPPLLRRRAVLGVFGLGLVAAVAALALFQPWKLVVDETVDEAAPPGIEQVTDPPGRSAPVEPMRQKAPAPRLLASGTLVSHEHESSGRVRVIALPDGRRILRLEDLDTSNGPDLHVWITDAPVRPGRAGWFVFDDGAYVDLGRLKGNRGSQNYDIPASVDLARLTSVTVWCDRFNVSFAAAALAAP